MTNLAVGIDLGTTNSALALINEHGKPEMVRNAEGEPTTPSIVYFGDEGVEVGRLARERVLTEPQRVATFFKRYMGDPYYRFALDERELTPVELSAEVLKKLKRDAEAALEQEIRSAVITVPAYFHNSQREDTVAAGRLAGLDVLRIINEPTAAATAYGVNRGGNGRTILVYDLGGGTFDVTLLVNEQAGVRVLATEGDAELGGKDWDDRLALYLADRFNEAHQINLLEDRPSYMDLQQRAEEAKRTLSARQKAMVTVRCQGQTERIEITREKFEELTVDLIEQTQNVIERLLDDVQISLEQVDDVLLVGGSTRMPQVSALVSQLTGKAPLKDSDPDQCVAMGAAVQAATELCSRGLAPRATGLQALASRQTRDVTSHSLGMIVEDAAGERYINSIILPKNCEIPGTQTKAKLLPTQAAGENMLDVYLLQGESDEPLDNTVLGLYRFRNVPHQRGGAEIDVSYSYDASGIIGITARDKQSGKELFCEQSDPGDLEWVGEPPVKQTASFAESSIYLLIDVSGSMIVGDDIGKAKAGAKEFIRECDLAWFSVGIIGYGYNCGQDAWVEQELTKDAKALHRAIDRLQVDGATPMAEALDLARERLERVPPPRVVVLLTDGLPDSESETRTAANRCRKSEVTILTLPIATTARDFMREIASSPEASFFSAPADLKQTFGTIARELTRPEGKLSMLQSRRGG